ncbi:OLC1v1026390C1 [Oldenlandia corymbosa var. corymbosa]|uniref:OLC1v1026390C1 n=1 Tax=Oldenlandia corymbosa var. corymbosa TaxID=529605 RepID=A0AAV1CA98_OLDCO|nr:OLC1v1026390C1 [Oldenlandia corymbosa var. corymbosa]
MGRADLILMLVLHVFFFSTCSSASLGGVGLTNLPLGTLLLTCFHKHFIHRIPTGKINRAKWNIISQSKGEEEDRMAAIWGDPVGKAMAVPILNHRPMVPVVALTSIGATIIAEEPLSRAAAVGEIQP